jgi:hypothetical protein
MLAVSALNALAACAIVDPSFAVKDSGATADMHAGDAGPRAGAGGMSASGTGGVAAGRDGGGSGSGGDHDSGAGGESGNAGTVSDPIAGSDAEVVGGSDGGGGMAAGGAGGTAGPTGGSAGMDPPDPVGDSRCYDTFVNRPVCLGFEEPLEEPWWEAGAGGTVNLISSRTYVGDGALSARAMAGQARFVGQMAYPAGLRSGSVYMRAYVYVPSTAVIDTVVVMGMSETDAPFGGVTVALKAEGTALDVHPLGAGVMPVLVMPATPFHVPRDLWNCMQLSIGIGGAAQGSVELRVNGTLAVQNGSIATLPGLGYRGLSAGLLYTDPLQPAIEVYVDEVVADTAPIPCDPPSGIRGQDGPLR